MRILYPYNEILPKKSAHDVFIVDECAALGEAGCEVTLLCGQGGLSDEALFSHYHIPPNRLRLKRIPLIRKNNPLGISWNRPFFSMCQRYIRKIRPDWVFLSVRKQGAYHLKRKAPHVRYLYEVHELAYYPHLKTLPKAFLLEQQMLARADLITVTTEALKQILREKPYGLDVPIEVVPLAVKKEPLPLSKARSGPFVLMYIGQLYAGQGLPTLLEALKGIKEIVLKVVGGKPEEITALNRQAKELGVSLECRGFIPPVKLSEVAAEADAFVAPFDRSGRMPYVAHTKLYEYAQWGRPFIAPNLPSVTKHFSKGVLFYEPENAHELAGAIRRMKDPLIYQRLQEEVLDYRGLFSWQKRAQAYLDLL